ncbi:MAG: alkane 1-monooxygenase [Gammaproteobacteria bacterium]|nr:alkane 1-monooxygenase [Gammaproteobacteria bacterium]
MKSVTVDSPAGTITYTDRKRWLWIMSMVYPLIGVTGVIAHAWSEHEIGVALPLLLAYTVIPFLDFALGEDLNNPPEEVVSELEADEYYRRLLHITAPLHFISFFVAAWWVGTQSLSWWAMLIMAVSAGMASGLAINTAHELGHKANMFDRLIAKIVLAVPGYGHFCIEHNAGHHRQVATPEDSASSKMGENIYAFAMREIPGGFKRGWQLEKKRLQRRGVPVWSLQHNDVLQSYAMTAVMQIGLIIAFGWIMVPFLLIHNFEAWWQLTSANYIEHYGLVRSKKDNGKYEHCQPHHSWNSNHIFSNLVLYHLERHSDHHAHPTRHYQSLRHFEHLPTLPNGYFGSYMLAYIPPLWYHFMDPKLVDLKHVQRDADKLNILPAKRAALIERFKLKSGDSAGDTSVAAAA